MYFTNPADGITLAGTLTLPDTMEPFPAVVLLHGSAPLDRDETWCGHRIFLVLADHLTRRGVAVLRFDKRGAGKSAGNYNTSTLKDFAQDALAAVNYLKTRKEINSKQIGFIGHSEGGLTATLASSQSKDIAFIVLMASPAINAKKIMHIQGDLLPQVDKIPEDVSSQHQKIQEQIFKAIETGSNRRTSEEKVQQLLTEYFKKLTDAQKRLTVSYYGTLENQSKLYNATWFRYWLTYDPTLALQKITCPVLALNGSRDLLVTPQENLPAIAKALEKGHNSEYTMVELPNLNHWFQTCQSGSTSECVNIEETMAPIALNTISDWITETTKPVK